MGDAAAAGVRELELLLLPAAAVSVAAAAAAGGGWVGPMGDAGHVGADGPTEAQVEQMFLALDADGAAGSSAARSPLAQDLGQDMSEDLDDAMAGWTKTTLAASSCRVQHWFIAQLVWPRAGAGAGRAEDDLRTKIVKIYELGSAQTTRGKVSEVDCLLAR